MTTPAQQKALDLFNMLMEARNELLPAIFEAKAKADTARAVVYRMADLDDGLVTDSAMDIVNEELMKAEHALNHAITAMVERDAAMWEAHAELNRLEDGKPPRGKPPHLKSVN